MLRPNDLRKSQRVYLLLGLACCVLVCLNATSAVDVFIRGEVHSPDSDLFLVTLYLVATDIPPSTLALYFTFDSNVAMPVLINNATRGADNYTQLAEQHYGAGFSVADIFHPTITTPPDKACLALVVYHPDEIRTLGIGELLSFSLRRTPEVKTLDSFVIEAPTGSAPLLIDGIPFVASASAPDERSLRTRIDPFVAPVNCTKPEPPHNVLASWRYHDRITISWDTSEDARALEYRVYKSTVNDIAQGAPISENWTEETVYTDYFEDEIVALPPVGCSCSSRSYFYWVRARDTISGCVSDFSAPPSRGTVARRWFSIFSCRGAE